MKVCLCWWEVEAFWGVWGAKESCGCVGRRPPAAFPPGQPSAGGESVGGQGREGSVGWAGSREPPPQNTGGCQHLASPQSTRAEYQGGPATDLAVSVSRPPPCDVGRKDSTAPREPRGTSVPSHCSWMRMRGHNRPALPSENSLAGEPTGEVEGAKNRDPRPTCLKSNLEALIPAQASPGPRPQPLPTDSGWQCLRCGPVVCTTFPERSGLLGRGSIFTFQGGRIPGVARLDQDGDTETQRCCFLYSKGGS